MGAATGGCCMSPQAEISCETDQQQELNIQGIQSKKPTDSSAMGANLKPSTQIMGVTEGSLQSEFKQIDFKRGNTKGNREQKINPILLSTTNEANTGQLVDREMNQFEFLFISQVCQENFLFKDLEKVMMKEMIDQMKLYLFQAGSDVFEQGQPGKNFYIISQGQFGVVINDQQTNVLKKGDFFGELALINDACRSATIRSITNSELWVLDRQSFQNTLKSLNRLNYKENRSFIDQVPLFEILTEDQKERIISALVVHNFTDGQIVIKEGDPGDLLYIIKSGQVKVKSRSIGVLRSLGKGEHFGEQALLYNSPRTATVTARGEASCLSLSRVDLQCIFGDTFQSLLYMNSTRIAFDRSETFKVIQNDQYENLISKMNIIAYEANDVVIPAATPMQQGAWVCLKGAFLQSDRILAETFGIIGDGFCQQPEGTNFSTNVTAADDTVVGFIDAKDIALVCKGKSSGEVAQENQIISTLQNIALFKALTPSKLETIAQTLVVKTYQNQKPIFVEGDVGSEFFIIKSGSVNIMKGGQIIRTMFKNDFFGERSILMHECRSATVIAAEPDTSCWTLSQSAFNQAIDQNVREQLTKRMQLQDDTVQLEDMNVLKQLGAGTFGCVYLCVHKKTGILYALKAISRVKIAKYKIEQNVMAERNLTLWLDNSCIMRLVKTFKDEHRVYFLLEYINGIDMWDALREINLVSNFQARFYVGCMTLALEHLAEKNILHRDLKPENVMVDSDGYARLIDFGTAKIIKGRTFTILGTPHYMAPEVITGNGYSNACDLWSVGIMLYEFVAGGVPFGEECPDPYGVYHAVTCDPLNFPRQMDKKHPSIPVIRQLLDRQAPKRGTAESLKKHEWFKGLNWEDLNFHSIRPDYIPQIDRVDTSRPMSGTVQQICLNDELIEPIRGKITSPANWDADF